MVPIAGEVLISVSLLVGVTSERETVEPTLGRGVVKLPGLAGGGGDAGSAAPMIREVWESGEGMGRGGKGGDAPWGAFRRDRDRGDSSSVWGGS